MDLLEYQAKDLFQKVGIPILPSQRIDHPKDLKQLRIPYPIVLKSQVYAGGRGKAGGVRFAENTIDAVAAAQAIFHLPILGQYPEVLLAEAKYEPDQELYLAVVLDPSLRRPLLLGSREGGMALEATSRQIQQVLVDGEFSPFYARRLAIKMGLTGELIESVSAIAEKMYRLFLTYDLDLVEINPLAVNPAGEVMALDGKVTVNDAALGRHPDLLAMPSGDSHRDCFANRPALSALAMGPTCGVAASAFDLPNLNPMLFPGSLGILCNGAGLTMATLDLVDRAGGQPSACLNLGGESSYRLPPDTLCDRLEKGLDWILQTQRLRSVLLNLLGGADTCNAVAKAIARYLEQQRPPVTVPLVVRLGGAHAAAARKQLAALDLPMLFVLDSLDEAITKAIALSEGARVGR
ncbi:succinate--CoA ligase subunit beta [Thermoleptolyngbya sp. C42_A2020_037]|uniref:succinate--CoA ligase subunit beta n=1 Tax=Thermoleptolyngbya sp. C42_A2020_037 TaxID=2747799 RepID=UPI0019FAF87D|nr:succinate--CoA ligase subunit beta [Thermoleptolyngbya sp. C42_A2020_037]MBF2084707.1 succinate--CoA ligase subunit beta [Thermoleptolyngbya sp. C42_A2020_037]